MNQLIANIHKYENYFNGLNDFLYDNKKKEGIFKIISYLSVVYPIWQYMCLRWEREKFDQMKNLKDRVTVEINRNLESKKTSEVAKENFNISQDQYISFLLNSVKDDQLNKVFGKAFTKLTPESQEIFFSQIIQMDAPKLDTNFLERKNIDTNLRTKDVLYDHIGIDDLSRELKMDTLSKVLEALPTDIKYLRFNCGSDLEKNFEATFVFINHLSRFLFLDDIELNCEDIGYYTSNCQADCQRIIHEKYTRAYKDVCLGKISIRDIATINGHDYKNCSGKVVGIFTQLFKIFNDKKFRPKKSGLRFKSVNLIFDEIRGCRDRYAFKTCQTSPLLQLPSRPKYGCAVEQKIQFEVSLNVRDL